MEEDTTEINRLRQRKAGGGTSAEPRSNKRGGGPTPVAYQRVKNESEKFNRLKRIAHETRLMTVFFVTELTTL